MEWGLIAALLVIVIILGVRLSQKQSLDSSEKTRLEEETKHLYSEEIDLRKNIFKARQELEQVQKQYQLYVDNYNAKTEELDIYFANQRNQRQQQLDNEFFAKNQAIAAKVQQSADRAQHDMDQIDDNIKEAYANMEALIAQWDEKAADAQQRYESLLEPLKLYEKERQDKLFYTIQLPDEFHDDIEFLLTTVALKVQHPDIISKLVWAEYVKPNLDNTFKRIEIKPEPGIYKLTNIDSGMAYIGKSTNVKTRIADHFKSSIGIQSVADQAVHHEILKSGFWNWSIEVITYCEKNRLNELEKYYIEFFNTQTYGYNKNRGGGG